MLLMQVWCSPGWPASGLITARVKSILIKENSSREVDSRQVCKEVASWLSIIPIRHDCRPVLLLSVVW